MSSDERTARRRPRSRSRSPRRDYYDHRHRNGSPSPYHSQDDNDSSYQHRHSRERRGTRSRSRDRSGSRRRRSERYHDELASGLDGRITPGSREVSEDDRERRRNGNYRERQKSSRQPRPSAFLAITGLPEDVDEVKLRLLFAPIPGILNLILWKEGPTEEIESMKVKRVKQKMEIPVEFLHTATLEMHSMAAAAALLASEWKDNAYYNNENKNRLHLEYQRGMSEASDWMCASSFCCTMNSTSYKNRVDTDIVTPDNVVSVPSESSTINFARRSHCYKCRAPRTPNCLAVEPGHRQKQQEYHQEQALLEAGWEPKAFDAAAVDVEQEQRGNQIKEESLEKKEKRANDQQDGYQLDPISGYLKHTRTGYLYDSNTGLYFHPSLQQWGTVNVSTGQFEQYDSNKSTVPAPRGIGGSSGSSAGGGTKAPKAAVIGAAPQINTDALRLAEEERKQRKLQEEQLLVDTERKVAGGGGGDGNEKGNKNSPAGQVQGVVHRGKWAQKRAAAQQEQQQQQRQL